MSTDDDNNKSKAFSDLDQLTLTSHTSETPLKIGVLTSGGDSQGMNAAIRAVVRMGIYRNCHVYAIYEGYNGLIEGGDKIKRFTWNSVADIIALGGTIIGTARCKEFRERSGRLLAAKNLLQLGIHSLVIIGGDGSLTGAEFLRREWTDLAGELYQSKQIDEATYSAHPFLSVVGIVGSIDNDMADTELTIGSNSSLHRILEAVDNISTSAMSHKRIFIIEVMGRNCGWLALMSAFACAADWVFIPEVPFPSETWPEKMCSHISRIRSLGIKRETIIIVSEGSLDDKNQPISCSSVSDVIRAKLGLDSRITVLGHIQRGGAPSAYDRILSTFQGVHSVEALIRSEKTHGCSLFIGVQKNKIVWLSLPNSVSKTSKVIQALQEKKFSQVYQLRDPDFQSLYKIINSLLLKHGLQDGELPLQQPLQQSPSQPPLQSPTPNLISSQASSKRIVIVHVGAPAGGMNMATYMLTRYGAYKNVHVYGLFGGWNSVCNDEATSSPQLVLLGYQEWSVNIRMGGSVLGTSRSLPNSHPEKLAQLFSQYSIDGLVIVGGYEAYLSLKFLQSQKKTFPSLNIPMLCIPATISNNVPGTEYTIGSDTALNMLVTSCDIIKQSASSTKRVFVIETQGGHCGYLTLMGGLAAAATNSYLPEESLSLSDISRDVNHFQQRFADDMKTGRLLLVNEKASKTYTSEVISNVLTEEGGSLFDSRACKPGHLLQGGNPSPYDRITAARLACLSIDKLVGYFEEQSSHSTTADVISPGLVIGFKDGAIDFSPVENLESFANDARRNIIGPTWYKHTPLVRILSKYNIKTSILDNYISEFIPKEYL